MTKTITCSKGYKIPVGIYRLESQVLPITVNIAVEEGPAISGRGDTRKDAIEFTKEALERHWCQGHCEVDCYFSKNGRERAR